MKITCISTGSKGNCYIVTSEGGRNLVLDCGVSYKNLITYLKVTADAALVTHKHGDHAGHVNDFLKRGIKVYAPKQVCDDNQSPLLKALKRPNGPVYKPFYIKNHWYVQPFPVRHERGIETVGFLIISLEDKKTIMYATDCHDLPPHCQFSFKSGGVLTPHPNDYMIIECNYDDKTLDDHVRKDPDNRNLIMRQAKRHMSLDGLIKWLSKQDLSSLDKIYICHMSERHGNADLIHDELVKETGKNIIIF
jgi:phosphoribosyl 1,2-cyclic phosphodiesterase